MLRLLALSFAAALLVSSAHAADVNVLSARHYGSDQALWDAFTRSTGIKVNVVEAEHDQLVQRLKSEGAGSPADVLITVDAGRLAHAWDAGLLQPVRIPTLDKLLPAHLRHPEGHWYGLAVRARVLVYHKDRINPADIATYEALADPRLKGRLLTRSGTNIYNLGLVGSIIAAHGPDKTRAWARGIVANLARPPQGGDTDQIKAVAAGVGDVAISNSYYLARLIASEKPEERALTTRLGVVFPNQADRGTHVNVSGAAITKHAPNKANALKLMEFLASPMAQKLYADANGEYPVSDQVAANDIVTSWGPLKADQLPLAKIGELRKAASELADKVRFDAGP